MRAGSELNYLVQVAYVIHHGVLELQETSPVSTLMIFQPDKYLEWRELATILVVADHSRVEYFTAENVFVAL